VAHAFLCVAGRTQKTGVYQSLTEIYSQLQPKFTY
jgi:hypothetical protein